MNWLEDNLFGRVMVYASGGLLLLAIVMAIVWSLPVSTDTASLEADEGAISDSIQAGREIASMNELQIINQKPLFNENRLPEMDVVVDADAAAEDTTITVKDAPDVKLTGVIITPDMKIATLTPASGDMENVMAHEGESLIGDFVGWKVGKVSPRTVVLRSNDGQQLELELQVHDMAIKEPPKPVATTVAVPDAGGGQTAAGQKAPPAGGDDQGLSRAEQIRQRIAERREELRLEQDARAEQGKEAEQPAANNSGAASRSAYQEAIRNMMNKGRKDNDSNEKSGG